MKLLTLQPQQVQSIYNIMEPIRDTYVCSSVVLAKYIVSYANANRYGINMTKLQKLLYISYGVYLAVLGERLTDEHPQAWPYGPVFPTTRRKLLDEDFADIVDYKDDAITDNIKACVKLVFDSFGEYNASYLSSWSHQDGSPWEKTTSTPGFKWGAQIPDEYIMPYFQKILVKKS